MIETRLHNARTEIEHWREYDYVVINDDLDRAFAVGEGDRRRRAAAARPPARPVRLRLGTAGREDERLRPAAAFSSSRQRVRQRDEFLDAQRLGAPRRRRCRPSPAAAVAAERFQALAQHLAALAEGGLGDAAERADVGRRAAPARGTRWTTEEVTFGGGVKACGGTSKAIRASVRQPASTPSRP